MRGIDEESRYFNEFSLFTEKLQEKIYLLRKKHKLTQEDMELFEISLRQYQRIESGQTVNITLSNLFKIAKALKIKPSQLLDI
ncbi:MAG: transcriptional regulator with XRE-family HTH domain [bacterium]|jgi:transcriptional regulator with XRE-family HTH domain